MKASELITMVQDAIKKHGDLEINCEIEYFGYPEDIIFKKEEFDEVGNLILVDWVNK